MAKTVFGWILDLHLAFAPYYSPEWTKVSISYSLNFSLLYGRGKTNPEICGTRDFLLGMAFFFLMISISLQLKTVSSSKMLSMGMIGSGGFSYFDFS